MACTGYPIFYQNIVLRKTAFHKQFLVVVVCILSLLVLITNVMLAINSCLQSANSSLPLCCNRVTGSISSSRRQNMDFGFLNYFLLYRVLSFSETHSVTASALVTSFLSCGNPSWLKSPLPSVTHKLSLLLITLSEDCHHFDLAKKKETKGQKEKKKEKKESTELRII